MSQAFIDSLIETSALNRTENNALTYRTTLNACLDFYFSVLQKTSTVNIIARLEDAWAEEPETALKLIFQLRDIRNGKAAKDEALVSLKWLVDKHPKTAALTLKFLGEYGCWKDLLSLLVHVIYDCNLTIPAMEEEEGDNASYHQMNNLLDERDKRLPLQGNKKLIYDAILDIFVDSLKADIESAKNGKTVSLAAKWAPTHKGSFDKKTKLSSAIAMKLFGCEKTEALIKYRKECLTPLRQLIDIPERKMSKRLWNEINYEKVPSVCMNLSKKRFIAHDKDRFEEYLLSVEMGKAKIQSGALLPHEIVSQAHDHTAQLQWEDYVGKLKSLGTFSSAVAVCDVSGSMNGIPMEVAIALSILISQLTAPPFDNIICSFSSNPQFFRLPNGNLQQKVQFTRNMEWGMNTDFQAVFDLILSKAIENKLSDDDMIKMIFVFSDMEFDVAGGGVKTDHQQIKEKFSKYGYSVPTIVYWNLRGERCQNSIPVTKNENNVVLVSGFSGQLVKQFLKGKVAECNPLDMMIEALSIYSQLKVID